MQGWPLLSYRWAHGENGLLTGQPGVELWGPIGGMGPYL